MTLVCINSTFAQVGGNICSAKDADISPIIELEDNIQLGLLIKSDQRLFRRNRAYVYLCAGNLIRESGEVTTIWYKAYPINGGYSIPAKTADSTDIAYLGGNTILTVSRLYTAAGYLLHSRIGDVGVNDITWSEPVNIGTDGDNPIMEEVKNNSITLTYLREDRHRQFIGYCFGGECSHDDYFLRTGTLNLQANKVTWSDEVRLVDEYFDKKYH